MRYRGGKLNHATKQSFRDQPIARTVWLVTSYLLIGIIGIVDYLTGYELALSPFYLFPVIFITWLTGSGYGIFASLLSTLAWWLADYLTGHGYSSPVIYYSNTLLRLVNFLVVANLVARLKKQMDNVNLLARSDVITGIANARSFLEFLDQEVARSSRYNHPITVIYMDLDNFKEINDHFGHQAGNQALRDIAGVLRDLLRKVDFAARIGGDEFAMVMPETGLDDARVACGRIFACLNEEMRKKHWLVTFSMGVISTEPGVPVTAERLLHQADNLMYEVKRKGKNSLLCAMYTL